MFGVGEDIGHLVSLSRAALLCYRRTRMSDHDEAKHDQSGRALTLQLRLHGPAFTEGLRASEPVGGPA
jgi:hypothetical protein